MEGVLAILCLFVILPGMVLIYLDRQKRLAAQQRPADPALPTADLARVAARLEQRIDALERVLDAEAPGWRNRHAE